MAQIAKEVFPLHLIPVRNAHRLDPGRQIGIKQNDRIVPLVAHVRSPDQNQLHPPFDHLVVPGAKPNPAADPRRIQAAGAHAVAADIPMPPRQGGDRALAEGAHAFPDLADGRHAFETPHEVVGVPAQHRRIGRPAGRKLPEFPHAGAPAVGVEAGPDRLREAARDEAGKGVADLNDILDDPLRHHVGGPQRRRVGNHRCGARGEGAEAKAQERSLNQPNRHSGMRHGAKIPHGWSDAATNDADFTD